MDEKLYPVYPELDHFLEPHFCDMTVFDDPIYEVGFRIQKKFQYPRRDHYPGDEELYTSIKRDSLLRAKRIVIERLKELAFKQLIWEQPAGVFIIDRHCPPGRIIINPDDAPRLIARYKREGWL